MQRGPFRDIDITFHISRSDGSEENPHANCMRFSFTTVTSLYSIPLSKYINTHWG